MKMKMKIRHSLPKCFKNVSCIRITQKRYERNLYQALSVFTPRALTCVEAFAWLQCVLFTFLQRHRPVSQLTSVSMVHLSTYPRTHTKSNRGIAQQRRTKDFERDDFWPTGFWKGYAMPSHHNNIWCKAHLKRLSDS